MGLPEVLKKQLGDDLYEKHGKTIQQEIAKMFVPKEDFNKVNKKVQEFDNEKKTLTDSINEYKTKVDELNTQLKDITDKDKSDSEKLMDRISKLENDLTTERTARQESENKYADEKKVNSISQRLAKAELNPKFMDMVIPKFKDVADDTFDATLKEYKEANKELFGREKLGGTPPSGSLDDVPSGFFTKEQVEKMSDKEAAQNLDKIKESQKYWK